MERNYQKRSDAPRSKMPSRRNTSGSATTKTYTKGSERGKKSYSGKSMTAGHSAEPGEGRRYSGEKKRYSSEEKGRKYTSERVYYTKSDTARDRRRTVAEGGIIDKKVKSYIKGKKTVPEKFRGKEDDGFVRLNKFIANSGVCSRREADTFISTGLVSVNGVTVTDMGVKINPEKDEVRFNGERLKGERKVYIVMNKPKNFVTTLSDSHADKLVIDLISKEKCPERVFPVGRLDKATTGVLMFTNDGNMAEKLTHPAYQVRKIYQASLDRKLSKVDFDKILEGFHLEDGEIHADALSYVDGDMSEVGVEIHSGRNRIVRRIFEHLGYKVKKLDRVYFAGLTKKNLKRGEWRFLTEKEISLLRMGAFE